MVGDLCCCVECMSVFECLNVLAPFSSDIVPEDERFQVRLRQSQSLLFHGPCQLDIDRDYEKNLFHLAIYTDDEQHRLIVKWQIDHIRQYGSNEVAFKFQSGRYGNMLLLLL